MLIHGSYITEDTSYRITLELRNPSTPKFLKSTHPSLNLDTLFVANRGFNQIIITDWYSVDPDETARDEPSHLDLHCLERYLVWSAGLKGFTPYRIDPEI